MINYSDKVVLQLWWSWNNEIMHTSVKFNNYVVSKLLFYDGLSVCAVVVVL